MFITFPANALNWYSLDISFSQAQFVFVRVCQWYCMESTNSNTVSIFLRVRSYLCLLLLSGVDNGCAAHFCNLTALAIERPAADLIANHVLDEEHSAVEPQ